MKYLYIAIISVVCQALAWSQTDEVNLLSNWDYQKKQTVYERINKVISTTNGFAVSVGETVGSDYKNTDGLFMIQDGETGEVMVWKKIGAAGFQSFNAVQQLHDGTFLLVGFTHVSEKDPKIGWVVQVDAFGEEIGRFSLPQVKGQSTELLNAAINEQGQIFAVGNQKSSQSSQPFILSIHDDLTYDQMPVNIGDMNELSDIASEENGHFVLVGNARNRGQIIVAKIDIDGQTIWPEATVIGEKGQSIAYSICSSHRQRGFWIAGSTTGSGNGAADMLLVQIDNNGQVVFDKTFGGAADDLANQVVELHDGNVAIIGQTKSHLTRAKNSTMQLVVTAPNGKLLARDIYPIIGGSGDEEGQSVAPLASSNDIIIAGNTRPAKNRAKGITQLGTITYRSPSALTTREEFQNTYGSGTSETMSISDPKLIDHNGNMYMEEKERGYVTVEISNQTEEIIENVNARVSSSERKDLQFWSKIYVGPVMPNEKKEIRIPVQATENLRKHNYDLSIQVLADEVPMGMSTARIPSNSPNPANLIVNKHEFSPEFDVQPGHDIFLQIDFENIGGQATQMMQADFHLPAGVTTSNSERISIPSLSPNESFKHQFVFQYQEEFQNEIIPIKLESKNGNFVKTFNYYIEMGQTIATSGGPDQNDMILWTSHDIDDLRSIDVNQKELKIKAITVSNVKLSKQNFAVMINGKRVQGQKLDETQLTPPNGAGNKVQQTYANSVRLQEGENEVQIIYQDEESGKLIQSSVLKVNYIPMDKPNLYVYTIGVQHKDLKYTSNDALAISNMYERLRDSKGRGFKRVIIRPLVDSATTTKLNIQKAFLNLSKNRSIKNNDLVVVFISSHGKVVDGDRYALLPSDYDPTYEALTTVDFNEDILKKLRTVDGNKLVFIDACHSGSAGSRSFSDASASILMNDLIEASSGMEIFASCGDHEFSYEDDQWKNGAFTEAIIEAFENKTVTVGGKTIRSDIFTEANGRKERGQDGVITIEELKRFVEQRVPYLVKEVKGKSQNPTNKSTELLPRDMGIFMVVN